MGFQSEAAPPVPGRMGPVYNDDQMNKLVRTIELLINLMLSNGAFSATTIQLTNLPTSPTGLRPGSVWRDGTNTLKVVPP